MTERKLTIVRSVPLREGLYYATEMAKERGAEMFSPDIILNAMGEERGRPARYESYYQYREAVKAAMDRVIIGSGPGKSALLYAVLPTLRSVMDIVWWFTQSEDPSVVEVIDIDENTLRDDNLPSLWKDIPEEATLLKKQWEPWMTETRYPTRMVTSAFRPQEEAKDAKPSAVAYLRTLCDEVSAMEDCDPVIKEWVDALVERLLGFSAMLYVEDLHFLGLLTNDYDKYVGLVKHILHWRTSLLTPVFTHQDHPPKEETDNA